MSTVSFQLEHVNMPARDPVGLARWYANTFGLQADEHRVRGPGVLLVFQAGEPVRAAELHVGFRVPSNSELKEWAEKLDSPITPGSEFNTFRLSDPEGNVIEIYCKANA